jgi:hypothetical protein
MPLCNRCLLTRVELPPSRHRGREELRATARHRTLPLLPGEPGVEVRTRIGHC